ncbi:hypothetical protein [Actinosynnema sp. NPDC020468]|uniref:hypothetical protein n=1 Tax=Actinosynnema sp. NPDC020468 TaxID=3154488 RepID=UPI0034080A63
MIDSLLIRKTLRVPADPAPAGDGAAVARQFDAALMAVGFKGSGPLLAHLAALAPDVALDRAVVALDAVRALVGDHVRHNPYFVDFPAGVPSTVEHWLSCLGVRWGNDALFHTAVYGRYRHDFAELVRAHEEFLPAVTDRLTVLHLGDTSAVETVRLYRALAGSTVPGNEEDLRLFAGLAELCAGEDVPVPPIREVRAVLNGVRFGRGLPVVGVDTVTDVLRLACQVSGGDPTLLTPTRFRAFRRPERRALMAVLDDVVAADETRLGDVARFARRWQRLGERLHPHEYPDRPHARRVFAVARGDEEFRSPASHVERAFRSGDATRAVELLSASPGAFARSLDRLLRVADPDVVQRALERVVGRVSGRVLLSVREHLLNRTEPGGSRVFVNRFGRGWATTDERPPFDRARLAAIEATVDAEIRSRLPDRGAVVVDPAVLDVALPLSGKTTADGFGVLPRGSVTPADGELLRFFTYWRESARTTDHDLSVMLLHEDFTFAGQVSWTNHHALGAYYSGDVTESEHGATEFIDVPLEGLRGHYVVPQVNVYSGEGFDQVAESQFGYMLRSLDQRGLPFEPATVRLRSSTRGPGRIALPVVFHRGPAGWVATWTQLYGRGLDQHNRVEDNRFGTALLARQVLRRRYFTVRDLLTLAGEYTVDDGRTTWTGPVTYVGLAAPDGLPAGSDVITTARLTELVPA